jgi:hypothetical protein
MDRDLKAIAFGWMFVVVYSIHQVTEGGDGVLVAAVFAAIGSIGGYAIGGGATRVR